MMPGETALTRMPRDAYSIASDLVAALRPPLVSEASDIVGAVLYLEDASFVTGEILHVDGGQSAGH